MAENNPLQPATKDDLNRIFNMLESISRDIKAAFSPCCWTPSPEISKKYQREDTLRADAVMRHEDKLLSHKNRITLLETKK